MAQTLSIPEPFNFVNDDDDNSYAEECGMCGEEHTALECKLIQITGHIPDKLVPSKARLTLPDFLEVKTLADNSFSVCTKEIIPKGTQFGPFQAKRLLTLKPSIRFPLKLFTSDEDDEFKEYFLDTSEETECSWMYFVSPAAELEEQNMICYQDKNNIYYVCLNDINPGEDLRVWYAPFYAEKINQNVLQPVVALEENKMENTLVEVIDGLVKSQQNIMKRDIWNCKFCGKLESNVTVFTLHLLEHYRLQLKKHCELCKATFNSYKNLQKHMKLIHSTNRIKNAPKETSSIPLIKGSMQCKDVSLGGPLLNVILNDSLDNSNFLIQKNEELNQFNLANIDNHNTLMDTENFNVDNLLNDNVKELDHFNFELKDAEEDIVCDICLKVFVSLRSLIRHLGLHTGKYFCKECNKIFSHKENLDTHKCNAFYRHRCTYCSKVFVQKKYLNRHITVRHFKKYACSKCSHSYQSKTDLVNHECEAKNRERNVTCGKCGKQFFHERALKIHSKIHETKVVEVKFICEFCPKIFTNKVSFNVHAQTHEEPKYACRVCDRKFHRNDVLKHHMLSHVVTNLETVSCDVCDKKLKSKKHLFFHKKMHQEAAYKCPYCPCSFRTQWNLEKHNKRKHKEFEFSDAIDLFQCPACNKKMKLKSSLQRHMKRIHADIKDYQGMDIMPNKHKFAGKKKEKKVEVTESDLNIMDLKETIDNMNFTTDISMSGNDESNINIEFEDMLKSTTDNIDFLNESNDRIVENLLSIPMQSAPIENKAKPNSDILPSMPDLAGTEQEIKLSNNAFILENGTIVEPQPSGQIVYYLLGEKMQV
ncbi:unnamed protein product [Brassicogethes aeneus]|uniref:Uncharacterized protein n=1 Tax=Brassicogethes aeneus TaxID=1431903 RepID=A0A9P0FHU8_BRAAE|nr:unnamed protein product [Brassicogethes aeneus]